MDQAAVMQTAFLAPAGQIAPLSQARVMASAVPDAAPAVDGGYSAPTLAMGVVAVGASLAAASQSQGRRSRRVGRSAFFGVKSEEEKAAEAAAAAQAAEEKQYQDFIAARDAMNLPLAVPFLGQPLYRDFVYNVPGDSGFDPLGFVKDQGDYEFQRRAELTHGRFAMLAAIGWPLSELFQPELAKEWGMPNKLGPYDRAPSFLNGGLTVADQDGITSLGLLLGVGVGMALLIENNSKKTWDPLKLEKFTPPGIGGLIPAGRDWMADAELKNGRLAMVAITAYVATEFITRMPVVKQTPFLF